MRFLFLFGLSLMVWACQSPQPSSTPATDSIPFRENLRADIVRNGVPVHTLRIEVADTDSARERGLMGRAPLARDEGMLFLFDQPGPQGFWMANTPSSLDILFISRDSVILNIARYTRPFSTQTVWSEGPAQYVLELSAGIADRYGISPGDMLRWTWP